ncbi:MAG: lipoate--protein ligase [Turicibacter sp.]|nr:lipoate--protein ligase [Turicibacter sp.]
MIYFYTTDCCNPYENLALENLILKAGVDGLVMYLWQNENTVVIGRHQNAWRECRLEAFAAENGRLARRTTGGGAVYHDLGNLNFSFVAPNGVYDVFKHVDVIKVAAATFGIDVVHSGRNDILADGKKFSGNAFLKQATHSLHHGTVLIKSDMGRLAKFLAPAPEKLAAKGVDSVRSRVINLSELNNEITPQKMKAALEVALAEVYGEKLEPFDMGLIDKQEWTELAAFYESDAWRLGTVSYFDFAIRRRFSFGEIEMHLTVVDGVIDKATLYSDAMDTVWIEAAEAAFTGLKFSAKAMAAAVPTGQNEAEREEFAGYLAGLSL